jgi:ABC-type nickel/cobalt efflux system permease component RcnA
MVATKYFLRSYATLLILLGSLLLSGTQALAHPMGNFSVNHYAKIKLQQGSVEILYLIDLAEIPTYQEMREFSMTADPATSAAARYLEEQEVRLKNGLTLEQDGQPLELAVTSRQLMFAEGAGGLPTMKLAFVFRGRSSAGEHSVSYTDNNFPGRSGWKEVVVEANGGTILQSSAPAIDRSQELTNYSTDLLNSPPQQLSATIAFRSDFSGADIPSAKTDVLPAVATVRKHAEPLRPVASQNHTATAVSSVASNPAKRTANLGDSENSSLTGSHAASAIPHHPASRSQNTPRSRFTELISTQNKLGFWVLLSAGLIAAGLGALHALEPGHGKTIVAAYLVGSRGTARHAVLLGLVVTASHTAGVYLLGVITLYASRYIVPDQLYPWLGAISGLSVVAMGVFIFLRHLTGESGEHSHANGENHSHWFLSMFKQGARQQTGNDQTITASSAAPGENRRVSLRELYLLGITGGIVPCPAALVVLLSAFSLHRIGFGLFLITAFSFGLASVLVIVGLTMVYAKQFMAPRVGTASFIRVLPLVSSAFMAILGVGIAVSAFASAPIGQSLLSKDKLVPFATVSLLGLFLGMRHSTDPDHVVAVSTIVSRQKSVKSSAVIGLLWGLGHTLTIFLVGSAIIIFGVVVPPRLGLSMEFCVALMLILLGVLNLTGALQWITERLSPKPVTPNRSASFIPESVTNLASHSTGSNRNLLERTIGRLGLFQTLRPLFVGLVHGLAGSAAVALLVLSTIRNPFWSTAYLLVFGVGTMAGMMLMTAAISAPLVYAGKKFFQMNRHFAAISGVASMAFGMFLVYHIGFVDGLFTAHVHWIPQ